MLRDMPLFVKPIFRDSRVLDKYGLSTIKKMTCCLPQSLSFFVCQVLSAIFIHGGSSCGCYFRYYSCDE